MAYLLQKTLWTAAWPQVTLPAAGTGLGDFPMRREKTPGGHRMYTLPGFSPCGGRKRDGYPRYMALSRASGEGGEAAHAPGRAPARGPGRRPCRNPGPVRRAPLRGLAASPCRGGVRLFPCPWRAGRAPYRGRMRATAGQGERACGACAQAAAAGGCARQQTKAPALAGASHLWQTGRCARADDPGPGRRCPPV